jgi:D-tyrosyl-tRNA(Tyr) deacylase
MIAVIQRVTKASVTIEDRVMSEIGNGYVILLEIFEDDTEKDIEKIVDKIIHLRVMADQNNKMNLSIEDVKGEILLVPQFTLCADTSQRRPSFIRAMEPKKAEALFHHVAGELKKYNIPVKTGKFGAYMNVEIQNDGPVTIIIDTKKL